MSARDKVRVLRVIGRLNMGGPAYHVTLLSGRLDPARYETLLVAGECGPGEASLEDLADEYGARLRRCPSLGPAIDPRRDVRALMTLIRIVRGYRPDIVHTHTAKAGFIGRIAALAGQPRPIIVHTYHGHVLEGYFGPGRSALYRTLERVLGARSERLLGVSQATVDDLVRLGIAPRSKFSVVPVGLDLAPFAGGASEDAEAFRHAVRCVDGDLLLVFVGRLVPVKRVDVLLAAFALASRRAGNLRLAIVGDGGLRPGPEAESSALGVSDRVTFTGYRRDVVAISKAADIAVLTSDNEGTPVSLIQAGAAGAPAVATAVGGVPEVVSPESGYLAPKGDASALAEAIVRMTADESRRQAMGRAARAIALERFSADRLLADVAGTYEELLARAA